MDLNALRERIDQVNDRLLDLFLERAELVRQVADYKRARGLPIHDPERERQVIERMQARAPGLESHVAAFFTGMMDIAKQIEAD